MNPLQTSAAPDTVPVARKPYPAPALRRVARMPLVTAGSFDLILPGAP